MSKKRKRDFRDQALEYIDKYAKDYGCKTLLEYRPKLSDSLIDKNVKYCETRFGSSGSFIVLIKGPGEDENVGEILRVLEFGFYCPTKKFLKKKKEIAYFCVIEETPSNWDEPDPIGTYENLNDALGTLQILQDLQTYYYENAEEIDMGYGDEWSGKVVKRTFKVEDGRECHTPKEEVLCEVFVEEAVRKNNAAIQAFIDEHCVK